MKYKRCFVTVGSTQFNELIFAVYSDDFLKMLHSLDFRELFVQCGSGNIPDIFTEEKKNAADQFTKTINGIKTTLFRYKTDISDEMISSDLIIGHAGAGTCMEVLSLGKPMIAVVNDTLMGNHQSELAEKLAEGKHLLYTTPVKLIDTLADSNLFNPALLPRVDPNDFRSYMQKVIRSL